MTRLPLGTRLSNYGVRAIITGDDGTTYRLTVEGFSGAYLDVDDSDLAAAGWVVIPSRELP